jgi:arylsulfatase A-like enzyme
MESTFSRRDFLKAASMLPLGMGLAPLLHRVDPLQQLADDRQNVLIIVFDAFSAPHLFFDGYGRQTTPKLTRLIDRAIVYHNHYAAGNFTSPGTASLLTGTFPWTHRALPVNAKVDPAFATKTIFREFRDYHRIAYSHNPLTNTLLKQFSPDIDDLVPQHRLFLTTDPLVYNVFGADEDIADVAWNRTIKKEEDGFSYSLFLSELYRGYSHDRMVPIAKDFPRGIPNIRGDNYFLLEDATAWLQAAIRSSPQPYLCYFHLMPPHAPCNTPREFFGAFARDRFAPPDKPEDVFTSDLTPPELWRQRTAYDEYLLYVDREFDRLFANLEASGALENTWLVLTSDHGELFERGVRGHYSPLLYQDEVRVPLAVFEPGRTTRLDITTPTSAVDLLPTLLQVTGHAAAAWTEGTVLPPFSQSEPDPERVVYSMYTNRSIPDKAITHATAMLVRGRYKVMYFFGYPELGEGVERVELYDLQADPEELNDLFPIQQASGGELLESLKAKLREVNEPYL